MNLHGALAFYEVDRGRILLDGMDIQRISRHRQMAVVLPDTWLFSGAVVAREGHRMDGEATDGEVVTAAARLAGDGFVRTLP